MEINETLADSTYTRIKDEIITGKIPSGSRISEQALAREYGVSRTPIREAIRRLSEQGLIKVRPCSHMEVTAPTEKQQKQLLELFTCLNLFSFDHSKSEALIKESKELLSLAEESERAFLKGEKRRMIKGIKTFLHSFYHIAEHEALSKFFTRSLEPLLLLILSTFEEEDKRVHLFIKRQKEIATLLLNEKIEEAREILAICAESLE